MPTVILLDMSLSMCKPVVMSDSPEPFQLKHLAIHGLNSLFDYMNQNCKLEFCSLMIFSSLWEVVVPFTRDFENLKNSLLKIECHDKTNIETALEGVKQTVLDEWGSGMPCQVIMITDGNTGVGNSSLRKLHNLQLKDQSSSDSHFPLPFPFPSKLHVVCLSNPNAPNIQPSLSVYQKLMELNGGGGQLFQPEGSLTLKSVQQLFLKLAETYYKSFHGILKCGNLSSNISLSPPPETYHKANDFEWVSGEVSEEIEICGFLDINDAANPPAFSRHLVLPTPVLKGPEEIKSSPVVKSETEADEEQPGNDEGKQPSFCVLLHGSLKVEGMIAICHLGGDWYGMLYSWADSKKKSNLMLSTFEPGVHVLNWTGNLQRLGPAALRSPEESGINFPVRASDKHSYSQNCVVWIRQSGLQADIQKILRHARKLPEKTQNFYKELNRLRRAALSFGFYELLEGMATILERECTLLPGTAHPDAALQLTHAASFLRNPIYRDYSNTIFPLKTKFNSDD